MGFSQMLFSVTVIFPIIVLLYYFFRKKYTDRTVASTLFWVEMMQETRVSPYLKQLQKNMLLFLQLLALLLLVLALMNPYLKKSTIAGAQTIFIVDTSATMLAGKGESTFEQHKKVMLSMLDELGDRPLTIITTGKTPTTIVQQETNHSVIEQQIEALEVAYETAEMTKSFDVAQAFIGEQPTSVYVFTDAFDKKQLPIEQDNVQWVVKGAASDLTNVALIRFAATANADATMALVQLQNDTDKAQTTTLVLEDADGQQVATKEVTVPPNELVTETFSKLPVVDVLQARIDLKDDYQADNIQRVYLQTGATTIAVDQNLHQLIQKGFQSIHSDVKMVPSLQLTAMTDATLVTNQTDVMVKGTKPVVLFGRDDAKKREVSGIVETTNDALFAFSSLEDIYVSAVYKPIADYDTLATIDNKPFIQRSPKGDIVVLADIEDTDWPLHPSFPLFLWSVEQQLSESVGSLGLFAPNEERIVALPQGEWNMYSEEDEFLATIEGGRVIAPTKPGIYRVRASEEERRLIVQLQAQERVIVPGTSYTIGTLQEAGQEEVTKASWMPWLIAITLMILVIEWEVQRRRGFTN